jgi:hypothetical protein
LIRLSIRSVNPIYLKLCRRLAQGCERESPVQGVAEVDKSYFGARKTLVFGF